ncbi:unnamed protein product [Chrysoparadoxa australica]
MKHLCLFSLIIVCLGFGDVKTVELEFFVTQKGKAVPIRDHEVKLSRRTFELNFPFRKTTSFLVSCSYEDATLKAARDNQPIEELPGFAQTGMAEGRFNDQKDVIVSQSAPSYWYYNDANDTRFDSIIQLDKKNFVGIRTIEQLYDVAQRKHVELRGNRQPLHFVFIAYDYDKRLNKRVEIKRNWLTINF